ncbi:MAG TPA: iron ABC transporter substrate-binding protein, partial [Thermoanaerobaculia bacterium]|nr:iron ABC transporter substrate-binding protein [Thermoanaerobaculia bacterium]
MASPARTGLRLALLVAALAAATQCRSDRRTPVVLYSPHGRDLLGLLETAYEKAHPEIDVRWLDMGSQEVYDRLRSEKANPQADVWYGGPDTIFSRGAREGLLAPYRPGWADAVAPQSRRAGDLYFGLY